MGKSKKSKSKRHRKVINLDRDNREDSSRAYAETFNIAKASHPFGCIFHMIFKMFAGLSFLFMGLFTSSSVKIFVTTMIFSCLDFWVTKNVTGRLLIGLRWWSGSDLTSDDVIGPKFNDDRKKEDEDVSIALKKIDEVSDNLKDSIHEVSQAKRAL